MNKLLEAFGIDDQTVLSNVITIAVTIVALLIVIKLINKLFKSISSHLEKAGSPTAFLNITRYIIIVVIYLAAFAGIASQTPALGGFLSALLAGSGLAALVVSVAAQDPISNLVSGIIIYITKPFSVGDLIRYVDNDISGHVEAITLRHTVVRTFENKRLVIPNGMINNCAIENSNYGDNTRICLLLDFSITYESNARLAMKIIADTAKKHPDYLDVRTAADIKNGAPDLKVLVTQFADSSVVIRAWCWARDSATAAVMRSDILLEVQSRFAGEGIEFAYPHMQIISSPQQP